MTEKKEMLLIEKQMWDTLVSRVQDLTLQISHIQEKLSVSPQYYSNKELRELLNVEEKLIRKYREQGLLSYSKVGDKYWYSQHDVIEFLNRNKFEAFA
ncbi:MAG: helix-turn-helix domain-containing protein [Bacteroidales bacterium]|nr:helix-turn-helix domain-containing protein [Bacteroidales bacterium]